MPQSALDKYRTGNGGNVNLYAQPKVKNPDGSTSTVDSHSYNIDGKEVLLPSVTPDGRHLKTDDEIVGEYKKTGRALGKFNSVAEANAYAEQLHNDYAAGKYDKAPSALEKYRKTPTTPAATVAPAAPSLTTRAKDVAIGAGKDLAQQVTGIPRLLASVGRLLAGPGESDRPDLFKPDLKPLDALASVSEKADNALGLHSTNRDQQIGKYGAEAAMLLSPFAVGKAKGTLAASKAGEASRVVETATREMPSLLTPRKMPTLTHPSTVVPRLGEKAPTTQQALLDALESVRKPEQPTKVTKAPPTTITDAGREGEFFSSGRPATFGDIAKESEKVAETVGPEKAATAIEQKVKLTVNELAQKMREHYGSQRAGKMLQPNMPAKVGGAQIKRLAPGESALPTFAVDDMAKRGNSLQQVQDAAERVGQRGEINPYVAVGAGGAALGAAAGATQGKDTTERIKNAAIGGVTGAIAVPLIAHTLASGGPQKLQKLLYTSVLSSPQSVIKAYLGGTGGAIGAALEKIAAGDAANGTRILNKLFSSEHITEMVRAIRTGGTMGQTTGRTENAPTILGRLFDGVNEPAIRAMEAGGVSREDAIRYTLSGIPTTPIGKDILGLWSRYFPLRLATTLFPRVGVQVLERGIERSPAGLLKLNGINEGVSTGTRVGRVAMGTGAGLAAAETSDQVPGWAKPYLVALSGVYGLPVGVGMAVADSKRSGAKPAGQVMAATQAVAQNMPFPQYGPADALNPAGALSAMLVPNVLRDVARARDPYERSTAGVTFGRAKAKIPGLRETLPVKGKNVNIAGQPNEGPSTPLERFFMPAAKEANRTKDVSPAVVNELHRLEIPINVPAFEKTLKIGQREVAIPPDVSERSRAERRQYLLPQVEKIMASPAYARADDPRKKRMLQAVITRAEAAGAAKARAHVIQSLRQGAASGSR